MTRKAIANAIKRWRRARGLTQRDLSERTGVHYVHIGRLERGEGNPRVSTLEVLAKVFRKRMVDFFTPPATAKRATPPQARRRGR